MKKIFRKRIIIFCIISLLSISIISCNLFTAYSQKPCYINRILLVNRNHKLSESYKSKNLVVAKLSFSKGITEEEKLIDKSIEEPLTKLFNAASSDGYTLYILSGYRSYETQKNIYDYRKKQNGKKYADSYTAEPGHSEHQTGLAVDLTNKSNNFTGSKEAEWLSKNSYKYGFIIRYEQGKENITGYKYEPWHIRYVGCDIAKKIYESKISLEEYLHI